MTDRRWAIIDERHPNLQGLFTGTGAAMVTLTTDGVHWVGFVFREDGREPSKELFWHRLGAQKWAEATLARSWQRRA